MIPSDNAGQSEAGRHALRRVRAERLAHKPDTFTSRRQAAQSRVRSLIWPFRRALKAYRLAPSSRRRWTLRARLGRIFRRRAGFVAPDRLLARLHASKPKLPMALDRPEIPPHTNGSGNDIRCQATKRKGSGGTRSDAGRDSRSAFLGPAKTCATLGIGFRDHRGDRPAVPGCQPVMLPPNLVSVRCRSP